MNVRYRVELNQCERDRLTALLSGGKHAARKLKRAQILLAADAGASDEDIARDVGVGGSTVYRTKRRFVLGNLEAALSEEPRPGAKRKLSGKEQALLVATACSKPPAGRARWTLELLAGELVRLTEHTCISRETVRRRLAGAGAGGVAMTNYIYNVAAKDGLTLAIAPRPGGGTDVDITMPATFAGVQGLQAAG